MNQKERKSSFFILFFFISFILLSIQCLRSNNKNKELGLGAHNSSYNKDVNQKAKRKTRELARIQKLACNSSHYVQITVYPQATGTQLHQYTIVAQALSGNGILLAAHDKVKGRFQYTIPLIEERTLQEICLNKGSADDCVQGRAVGLKCKYQPQLGAQKGDNHKLQIIVRLYDTNHHLLQEKVEEVSFLITKDMPAADSTSMSPPLPIKKPSAN